MENEAQNISHEQIQFAVLFLLQKLEGGESSIGVGKEILGRLRRGERMVLSDSLFVGHWVNVSREIRKRLGSDKLPISRLEMETGLIEEDFALEAVKAKIEIFASLMTDRLAS